MQVLRGSDAADRAEHVGSCISKHLPKRPAFRVSLLSFARNVQNALKSARILESDSCGLPCESRRSGAFLRLSKMDFQNRVGHKFGTAGADPHSACL